RAIDEMPHPRWVSARRNQTPSRAILHAIRQTNNRRGGFQIHFGFRASRETHREACDFRGTSARRDFGASLESSRRRPLLRGAARLQARSKHAKERESPRRGNFRRSASARRFRKRDHLCRNTRFINSQADLFSGGFFGNDIIEGGATPVY